MNSCLVCNGDLDLLVDLGNQPVSNALLSNINEQEFNHPLRIGQCAACGLVQIMDVFPLDSLELKHNLIAYSEPEEHLDELAQEIANLAKPGSKVLGISYKDQSLIDRLNKLGLDGKVLDPKSDLKLKGLAGPELVQASIPNARLPTNDIIIVRHLFEHTSQPLKFLESIMKALAPGGFVVIEVPDCTAALEELDYSMIWEEHNMYFTPSTLRSTLNLKLDYFKVFDYPLEGSIVAIGRPGGGNNSPSPSEFRRAQWFSVNFERKKEQVLSQIPEHTAFFGAGHLACVFINAFGIKNRVKFIMDDNPIKKGKFMPGSKIPIVGSDMLKNANVDTCILSVNPRNEMGIVRKHAQFTQNGGMFISIFPSSRYAMSLKMESPQVYRVFEDPISIGDAELSRMKSSAATSELRRCRICCHSNSDDIHEMIVCIMKDSYIQPHRHPRKSESFHVISGEADVVLFSENGKIQNIIRMGPAGSGKKFFYRLNKSSYHTVVVKSESFIFHETTNGPFKKEQTQYAPWAPDKDSPERLKYLENLRKSI